MKKILSLILTLLILITSIIPATGVNVQPVSSAMQELSPIKLNNLEKTSPFNYDFKPATALWKNIVGNEQPGRFKNVTYTLAENVIQVDDSVVGNIKSAGQILGGKVSVSRKPMDIISEGGFIGKNMLHAVFGSDNIQPGTVFYNPDSQTAFKLVTPTHDGEAMQHFKDNYMVTKPQIHEVISDFNLPKQTVNLTKANITGFADPIIESCIVEPDPVINLSSGSDYDDFTKINNPLIKLKFPYNTNLKGTLSDGSEITVTLNGGFGIGSMDLEGSYSGFSGYRLGLKTTQENFLQVQVGIKVYQEIRIPILGIDVPFGIGRVTGGLFLVVKMDGSFTLEMQTRAWATSIIGVKGSTCLYVPTSVNPWVDLPDKGITGDVSISGKINGSIKAGPMLSIEIFGSEMVGAGAFLGAELAVKSDDLMLDIELYGIIQAYICLLGKHYNLTNTKIPVLRRQQTDMGGYRVQIDEACVYQDRVGGTIKYDYGGEDHYQPEGDVKLQIEVTPANTGIPILYKPDGAEYYTTDAYGEFIANGISLSMGDKVRVLLMRKDNSEIITSGPANPTFPFKNIYVYDADYFNDYVEGQVFPVKVRNWGVHTGDDEKDYIKLYYTGNVTIQLLKYISEGHFWSEHWQEPDAEYTGYTFDQQVTVQTNEMGNFKAEGLITTAGTPMDVRPGFHYDCSIMYEGFLVTTPSNTPAKTKFALKRVTEKIAGSEKRYIEGDKVIDQISINERYYFINMRGTRQLEADNLRYEVLGFSTQDSFSNHMLFYDQDLNSGEVRIVCGRASNSLDSLYPAVLYNLKITPEQTEDGKPNGTSLIDNRVVTKWVWQPHSNPTIITSADHYTCDTGGSTFQVTATGVEPIQFRLTNAPSGVSINGETGLISVSGTVPEGEYQFTITATGSSTPYPKGSVFVEGIPKYWEDDAPPANQKFTLVISDEVIPSPTPTPLPAAKPDPSPTQTPNSKPTQTPKPSPIKTPSPKPVLTPKPTPSQTPSPKPTLTPKPTPTQTPSPKPTLTPKPTPTLAPKPTPTLAPKPTPKPAAPVITSPDRFSCGLTGGTFQVTATGASPIQFSLVGSNPDTPVPNQVEIDQSTGLMTISRGLSAGTYQFYVVAHNGIRPDSKQLFTLTVRTTIPLPTRPIGMTPAYPSLTVSAATMYMSGSTGKTMSAGNALPLETPVQSGTTKQWGFAAEDSFSLQDIVTTQNTIILRNDDPEDLYDSDSLWVQGAEYVKWDGIFTLSIEGVETQLVFIDRSPSTDHHLHSLTQEQIDTIKRREKEMANAIYIQDWEQEAGSISVDPIDEFDESTILDYGSILNEIDKIGSGQVNVLLGGSAGTFLPGAVFNGLKENPETKLALLQQGATITFAGSNIGMINEAALYNFAFSRNAPHAGDMLQAAGNSSSSFTYAFAHNGNLPGYSTFQIETGMQAGTSVNIYKYESESGIFSLIASDVKVDAEGVVKYNNNMTSEYIITTQTIAGAMKSEALGKQAPGADKSGSDLVWVIVAGVLVLLVIAGVVWVLLKRRNGLKPGKTA